MSEPGDDLIKVSQGEYSMTLVGAGAVRGALLVS